MAHAPCAAGAANTTVRRTAAGRVAAISSATMPPSDPPVTSAGALTPRWSSSAQTARAWSRVVSAGIGPSPCPRQVVP